ncbi:hypothetical protein OE810_02410 [Rhodobacteraceae bacterium XHP0102]|nr:hypothetical protein [Rhodobacteraceae bacterium XHP0102]
MNEEKDSADIEDVLSSIRRLVAKTTPSQGTVRPLRAEPRLRPTRLESAPAVQDEKLVLSPSQRVSEPENPWTVIPLDPLAEEDTPARPWGGGDRLADFAENTSAARPDGGEDALGAALAAAAEGLRQVSAETAAAPQQTTRLDPPVRPDPSPEPTPAPTPAPASPKAAEGDTPVVSENPSAAEDMFTSEPIAALGDYDEEVETLTLFAAPPPPLRAAKPTPPPDTSAPEDGDVAKDADAASDVDDLGHDEDLQFGASQSGQSILLDHEDAALRALVARVVREELQGDLGQRITSNLRKLVRREIRIILAAEQLD